jgi:urease accessory protein
MSAGSPRREAAIVSTGRGDTDAPMTIVDSAAPSHVLMPHYIRDASEVRATFVGHGLSTRLDRLRETGALRLRLPKVGGPCEAVLLNTGGGIAGGDRQTMAFTLGAGAHVTATTQAAEKIYKAESAPATIAVCHRLGPAARLAWLPQETILHDGARAARTLEAHLDDSAVMTWLETIVFGRLAHGESLTHGSLRDRWRIWRGERLVLADTLSLDGRIGDALDRPAGGAGARAVATLVHVGPGSDARLTTVREALAGLSCACGASAWNGVLVTRIAGADPAVVRAAAGRAAEAATGAPLPRSWTC